MFSSGVWSRSSDTTIRTRLVMAGAFVGALLLLLSSMLFSWPVASGGAASTAEREREKAFDAPTGSCLSWTPPEGTDIKQVDCAQPHLFEITSNVDISADYPGDAPSPDLATWQQMALAKCTPGATAYVGGKLDPFGKFTVNALKPSAAQWRDGDRKLRCGLQRGASTLLATSGTAANQDQSNTYDPGTCLALDGQEVGDPVPCEKAHAVEVVGNADLAAAFPGEYPTEDAQREKLIDLCAEVTKEYTGGADIAAQGLIPYPDTLKAESWAAGSRKVNCKVAAKLPDGSGLAPVTGSIKAAPAGATTTQPPASPTPGG